MASGERILILDAEPESRRRLETGLRQAGLRTRAFQHPDDLLAPPASLDRQESGCLIVDQALPPIPPAAYLASLRQAGWAQPLIFVGWDPRITEVVAAIKAGAQDFLEEPVSTPRLLTVVAEALRRHGQQQRARQCKTGILLRYQQLTTREREVMALVCRSRSNKEIARDLDISPRTVENHRAHLMTKMQAHRVADLCNMAAVCHQRPPPADLPAVGLGEISANAPPACGVQSA